MKNSNIELKNDIEYLVNRGGNDWQSILRDAEKIFTPISYNIAQLMCHYAVQKYKVVSNIWGRGTGKTTSIGDTIRQMKDSMPRASGAFVSPTYQYFLTRIIPSLVNGLEMQGLYQNLHYFIGRRPPKNWKWPEPYQPPKNYDRYVIFYNGFGFHLVSQDVPGDGRGLNLDFILTDESALLSKEKLEETVEPALRGTKKSAFEKSPFWGIQVHHTSMPLTQKGQWLFDLEEMQREEPETIKTIKANALVNKENLMDNYLEERRKTTLPWIFDSEYLNIRPNKIENGFYALLDEQRHGYNGEFNYGLLRTVGQQSSSAHDNDCIQSKPLLLGLDWGSVINSLIICQHTENEIRAIKSMYVLGDNKETQDDLADKFCEYYAAHPTKIAYMHYDRTGNISTGNTRVTRAQQFQQKLIQKGWSVQLMTQGNKNPEHERKRLVWERILQEDHQRLPKFRINVINAKDLLISMLNTKVKRSSTGIIQKDKSGERSTNKKRQHATDLSDAIDTLIFDMFGGETFRSGIILPKTFIQ